jgi:hypothetical protein
MRAVRRIAVQILQLLNRGGLIYSTHMAINTAQAPLSIHEFSLVQHAHTILYVFDNGSTSSHRSDA